MLRMFTYHCPRKMLWLLFLLGFFVLFGLSGCLRHGSDGEWGMVPGQRAGQGEEQGEGQGGAQNGVQNSGQRVVFIYSGPAERVCVGGTFNNWSEDRDCLVDSGGRWRLELFVPSGRHGYGFFIDGHRFHTDPHALMLEDDGFGRVNSVLIVD